MIYSELTAEEKNLFNDIEQLSLRSGENSFNKVIFALYEKINNLNKLRVRR